MACISPNLSNYAGQGHNFLLYPLSACSTLGTGLPQGRVHPRDGFILGTGLPWGRVYLPRRQIATPTATRRRASAPPTSAPTSDIAVAGSGTRSSVNRGHSFTLTHMVVWVNYVPGSLTFLKLLLKPTCLKISIMMISKMDNSRNLGGCQKWYYLESVHIEKEAEYCTPAISPIHLSHTFSLAAISQLCISPFTRPNAAIIIFLGSLQMGPVSVISLYCVFSGFTQM